MKEMGQTRGKQSSNFLQGFLWTDERFHYLQISVQIVTIVSLICATSEVVFGCWSLNILTRRNSLADPLMEISSTKSKYVAIGIAIFLVLSARIAALIFWIRSTRNENLRCYSVTSHCTFLSVFVMLGLAGLIIHFVYVAYDFTAVRFRAESEVLMAFCYISGFDILFTSTFALAVASDLQCRIKKEWEGSSILRENDPNWVRPCRMVKANTSRGNWRESARVHVHEVYV